MPQPVPGPRIDGDREPTNPPASLRRWMGTASSTAAPERIRWPRLVAAPQAPLRLLLPRGYVGFNRATAPRHLDLPATTSIPLVVKTVDSRHRPAAFAMGAPGSFTVLEGACAPFHLEALLAPLGAYRPLGQPTAGAWPSSSATPRAGGSGSRWWTGSCWSGWSVGRGPPPRSAGPGGGWSPPAGR